jgi:dTDP-4-dehydrorhamnose reductase
MTRRVCLLTGAGGKLGTALLREFAPEYDIVATYRRTVPHVNSQLMRRAGSAAEPRNSAPRCAAENCPGPPSQHW